MATHFQFLGRQPDSLPSSKFFCEHEDGQMERVSAQELLESESLVQEKIKKKKKKHKGSLQSPKQILAFNTAKLLKLDEQKTEMTRCFTGSSRFLSKSSSFPVNSTLKAVMEGSGDSQDSHECAISSTPHEKIPMPARLASLPLKSALRGSFEELGIGPRPKLHVQWDPSVWEPPCSTISHTVSKNCPKKKGSRHGRSGRFNMQQSRHKAQNGKCNSDPRMPLHEQSSQDGYKDAKISTGKGGPMKINFVVLGSLESKASEGGHVSRELATHRINEKHTMNLLP